MVYLPKDYTSNQAVRWCPGCGDYAVLKTMKDFLAKKSLSPENNVFISGIGCASRFPYYIKAYGFHTIHGRAAAIASGVRLVNSDLNIWVISGDGDSLSIGGNHLFHLVRRNIKLQYLLLNNEVYGLTKGQYSPTSPTGFKSPSSPHGSLESPACAGSFVLGAGGKFFARVVDIWHVRLMEILEKSLDFPGTAFIEILQNCVVYHDEAFKKVSNRQAMQENTIWVEHNKPLIFGTENKYGLVLDREHLVLTVGSSREAMIHDETNKTLAMLLTALEYPRVFGIIYRVKNAIVYDSLKNKPYIPQKESIKQLLRGSHVFSYE